MTIRKIPLTVLGGFLGSGKTTLLNHLLATTSGRRIAVLVNDFGPINIDARLIAEHDGQTMSLTNGCICCSIGSGLDAALIDVLARDPQPDWIVIEASGVSDPAPIADVGLTESSLRLAGVVTVLDAEHIEEQSSDPLLHDTVARQVRAADLLVLNKTDLITAEQLDACKAFLTRTFGGIPIFETTQAIVPEDLLLDTELHGRGAAEQRRNIKDSPHGHRQPEHPFVSLAWTGTGIMSADRLLAALRGLPRSIIRAKGTVTTDYHGPAIVHFAGRRVQFQRLPDDRDLNNNELVYIGLPDVMDADKLYEISDACVIAPQTDQARENIGS